MKIIYVDSNPYMGVYVVDDGVPKRVEFKEHLLAPYCELEAIYETLKAQKNGSEILLYNDNEVAMNVLNLDYGIHKKRLREKCFDIWNLIESKNLKVIFKWIPRRENKAGKVLG